MKSRESRRVWGFEGCGAMWSFFSDAQNAINAAGQNPVYEFTIDEAWELDCRRRQELGHKEIAFKEFLECVDTSILCVPENTDC